MTKQEMIEHAQRAIEEFNNLPVEEQTRRLIAKGTINEKGEVLMGLNASVEDTDDSDEATAHPGAA